MSTGSVVCGDVTSSGTVSAPQLFASNTLTVTNTSDFSDDLFLTKNWAGWSKLQVSNNSAAPDSGPELRLLGNQSARVFLERDGGTHQCELIMINDKALVQTKSLSTQLSLTTNQRNSGCLVTQATRATWSATQEEFDGHRPVERRHEDGYPRLLSPHQRAVGGVLPGPAGQGGSPAGAAGAEEQVGVSRPPGIQGTLRKPFFGATSRSLQGFRHPGNLE